MAGPTQTAAADVNLLVEAASKLGLTLNVSKCELIADDYSITRAIKIFDGFRETQPHKFTLLGAPILKGKTVEETQQKKWKRLKEPFPD